ncbi:hypothetical protein [Nonomuraea sp. NPDC003804]|uniref:hypothetical protein n=1 Tax=Nonomuraea sp. NPDC003804 TaxID=3154547 RepID=UPI0033A61353
MGLGVYEKGGDVAIGGGKVFVSGRDRIVVATPNGTIAGAITGLSGAVGLAAASDGSHVYAALSGSNQVAEIDTDTLAITRRIDVEYPCPTNLSLSGTQLLVGYGHGYECDGPGGGVFSLDLSAEAPEPVQIQNGFSRAPLVAAAKNTLVVSLDNQLPAHLFVYDLNGSSATLRGTIDGSMYNPDLSGPIDLTVTADGSTLVTAFGNPEQFESWNTTTLTRVRTYQPPALYPHAVAVSPDGAHIAGGSYDRVRIYNTATAESAYTDDNQTGNVVPGSLTFSGPDVLGVIRAANTGRLYLWRVQGALLPPSTMTLSAPSTATALEPLTLTGRLTAPDGSAMGAQPVSVTRRLPDGTTATVAHAATMADGTFTITDTPPVAGELRYEATWAGSSDIRWSSASAIVTVGKHESSLTLSGPAKGKVGKQFQLTGAVNIGGQPPAPRAWVKVLRTISDSNGTVTTSQWMVGLVSDGSFGFTETPAVDGHYTYTVQWAGDSLGLPVEASHEVAVKTEEEGGMAGNAASEG